MTPASNLPPITNDDKEFITYNPNTDDVIEFIRSYALAAIAAGGKPLSTESSLSDGVIDMIFDMHQDAPTVSFRYLVSRALIEADRKARATAEPVAVTDKMVSRFLWWKLPDTFNPDGGITFKRVYNEASVFGPQNREPVGTNLFTADEARAMLEHVLGGAASGASPEPTADLRDKLGRLFHIGSASRDDHVILENATNALRRSDCLAAVERKFFTKIVKDEDGDYEECSLTWGASPAEYIEQFRAALAAGVPTPEPKCVECDGPVEWRCPACKINNFARAVPPEIPPGSASGDAK